MKRFTKILMMLIAVMAVPAIAGLGIMALWNDIITTVCGFATVTFWQSMGLFILGQLLSGGFMVMLFVLIGGIHSVGRHHADWHNRWHNMTDDERRRFILSRRDHSGFRNRPHKEEDAVE